MIPISDSQAQADAMSAKPFPADPLTPCPGKPHLCKEEAAARRAWHDAERRLRALPTDADPATINAIYESMEWMPGIGWL
jgi:hypothetical protein